MFGKICFIFVVVIIMVSLVYSCESQSGGFVPRDEEFVLIDEETDVARLDSMHAEIQEMIGAATCINSSNCRYVAFGVKPCGGPWGYLIYSVVTVDEKELFSRVNEYNHFNDTLNKEYGWYSDCAIEPVPTVGCKDGHCVDLSKQ